MSLTVAELDRSTQSRVWEAINRKPSLHAWRAVAALCYNLAEPPSAAEHNPGVDDPRALYNRRDGTATSLMNDTNSESSWERTTLQMGGIAKSHLFVGRQREGTLPLTSQTNPGERDRSLGCP